jgi:hypothetical protein
MDRLELSHRCAEFLLAQYVSGDIRGTGENHGAVESDINSVEQGKLEARSWASFCRFMVEISMAGAASERGGQLCVQRPMA